jgi:L-rhamnonate dehydratase
VKIVRVEQIAIGCPPEFTQGAPGEFLVTPLHVFPDYQRILGERFVGLRGGDVYAVLVRVTTDEGLSGLGSVGVGSGAASYIIEKHLAPILTGQNPFDVELLWEQMFRSTINYGRKGVTLEAISAVDISLWDIIGKATGQPVYNLLGGKTRDRIQVYASRLYAHSDLDALASQAAAFVAQGFRAVKQRFGYGPRDGLEGMRRNLELVKTVRQSVGPDVEIMADAYMGWDVTYAIRMIRMLEDANLNLRWIEEPVVPDDIDGYARIRRSVSTPISGGEHEFTRHGFRDLIVREAVDILQPDVNRVGGITEARKIWALAAANNLTVIPHAGQMHNYHVTMSSYAAPIAEYFPKVPVEVGNELFWYVFEGEPVAERGFVDLANDKPGFGLTLKTPDPAEFKLTR